VIWLKRATFGAIKLLPVIGGGGAVGEPASKPNIVLSVDVAHSMEMFSFKKVTTTFCVALSGLNTNISLAG
jgi:hypothetical protein